MRHVHKKTGQTVLTTPIRDWQDGLQARNNPAKPGGLSARIKVVSREAPASYERR
jgi:hypothetical protein